jgi:hypothetical protein
MATRLRERGAARAVRDRVLLKRPEGNALPLREAGRPRTAIKGLRELNASLRNIADIASNVGMKVDALVLLRGRHLVS